VVWLGRYFALDNENEHWFDNWEARDNIEEKAKTLGLKYENLLIIDPDRFKNGLDGQATPTEKGNYFGLAF